MQPETFREIAVFVAGATPQVITETIYALAHKRPPIHLHEIHIITTATGKNLIEKALLGRGILAALLSDYGLPPLPLTDASFVIVKDSAGLEVSDIRTEEENRSTGDAIVSLIRRLTDDPGNRLHCSIAGGRKTMSFYLGASLQLFGRPWDRLYHVLVTPEFESNPAFFYKPRKAGKIEVTGVNGRTRHLNTADAEITLAELPFVRLRQKIRFEGKTFEELVAEGQADIDMALVQPPVRVNLSDRTVRVADREVELVAAQLMLYVAFLRQKLDHCRYPERAYCGDCSDCFRLLAELAGKPALEAMAKDYRRIYAGSSGRVDDFLHKWKEGMSVETIRQGISKINRALREQVGSDALLACCLITNVKQYGSSRYGVRAEKGKIGIE